MPNIILNHPVHTLENQILFPSGAAVTEALLDEFIASAGKAAHQTRPLLQYGSVKEDLMGFLRIPPYDVIFSSEKDIAGVLGDVGHIDIVEPVLQSLDYFRENDFYSYRHFISIFALSAFLARHLFDDYKDIIRLAATGPTHDIGKTCVPLHILNKATPLTRAEKAILDNHSTAGYILLSYYLGDTRALSAKVARDHHERINGSGYPRGIRLNNPMVELIAVCDVYDALISPRPYRSVPFDNRAALELIISMGERNEISWDVIKALVSLNRKSKPDFRELDVSSKKRGSSPPGNVYGLLADEA